MDKGIISLIELAGFIVGVAVIGMVPYFPKKGSWAWRVGAGIVWFMIYWNLLDKLKK